MPKKKTQILTWDEARFAAEVEAMLTSVSAGHAEALEKWRRWGKIDMMPQEVDNLLDRFEDEKAFPKAFTLEASRELIKVMSAANELPSMWEIYNGLTDAKNRALGNPFTAARLNSRAYEIVDAFTSEMGTEAEVI